MARTLKQPAPEKIEEPRQQVSIVYRENDFYRAVMPALVEELKKIGVEAKPISLFAGTTNDQITSSLSGRYKEILDSFIIHDSTTFSALSSDNIQYFLRKRYNLSPNVRRIDDIPYSEKIKMGLEVVKKIQQEYKDHQDRYWERRIAIMDEFLLPAFKQGLLGEDKESLSLDKIYDNRPKSREEVIPYIEAFVKPLYSRLIRTGFENGALPKKVTLIINKIGDHLPFGFLTRGPYTREACLNWEPKATAEYFAQWLKEFGASEVQFLESAGDIILPESKAAALELLFADHHAARSLPQDLSESWIGTCPCHITEIGKFYRTGKQDLSLKIQQAFIDIINKTAKDFFEKRKG